MNEEILLSITMLVSDREDTIEKCMKSLVHLREVVPSELIVVDTAGNLVCMDIVRQYTDNIVRFEWCNDFAAARNAGVSRATGEWLMYLDDDEWFESTAELERFFLSGRYHSYHAASYIVRSYSNTAHTKWNDFAAVRLAKREKDTLFQGRIHEHLSIIREPVCYINDYVHHVGYVFKSPQEAKQHSRRNIQLLLEMRKADPEDAYTAAQLIQEYAAADEYSSAIELCREVRRMSDCWTNTLKVRHSTYAVMMEMNLYVRKQRFDEGYHTGKELFSQPNLPLLARGILQNHMIRCCYELKKYDEALEYMEGYLESVAEWEAWEDDSAKKQQDAFSRCAVFMNPEELHKFSLLQLHIHVLQKKWMKAGEDILTVSWSDNHQKLLEETPADIISTLKKVPFDQRYTAVLEALYKTSRFKAEIYEEIDKSHADEKNLLISYLQFLPLSDSKLCQYRLIYAGSQGDVRLAVPALEKMEEAGYPFFLADSDYWNSLSKLNIDINSCMTALSTYEWIEMAKRLWSQASLEICETAYLCLLRGLEKTDLRYLYLSALIMEKRLLTEMEWKDFISEIALEEIWNRLSLLSQYWVSCAASLYREDVFMSDLITAIPPVYQFGWYIMQAGAVKDNNPVQFVRKMADAAKAYPVFKLPV